MFFDALNAGVLSPTSKNEIDVTWVSSSE
jgi:hypothetical protein